MRRADIERIARETLERGLPESDCVEYKKSDTFAAKILKTACAFANNYNNRELGLLFIGVDEVDDPSRDAKAVPVRPIAGVAPESVEPIENRLKALFANPLNSHSRIGAMAQICSLNIALGAFYAAAILASSGVCFTL